MFQTFCKAKQTPLPLWRPCRVILLPCWATHLFWMRKSSDCSWMKRRSCSWFAGCSLRWGWSADAWTASPPATAEEGGREHGTGTSTFCIKTERSFSTRQCPSSTLLVMENFGNSKPTTKINNITSSFVYLFGSRTIMGRLPRVTPSRVIYLSEGPSANTWLTCRNNLSESRSRARRRSCCTGRREERSVLRPHWGPISENPLSPWLTCTFPQPNAWWSLTCEVWVHQQGWCLKGKEKKSAD